MKRRDVIGSIGAAIVTITAGCSQLKTGSTVNASEEESSDDYSQISDDDDVIMAEDGTENLTVEDPWRGVTVRNTNPERTILVAVRSTSLSPSRTFKKSVELGPGEDVSYPDATPDTGQYQVAIELPELNVERKGTFDADPHRTLVVSVDDDSISFAEIVRN